MAELTEVSPGSDNHSKYFCASSALLKGPRGYKEYTHPNAKFTLHNFSMIFHLSTGFDKSQTNARHSRQIGARSRE